MMSKFRTCFVYVNTEVYYGTYFRSFAYVAKYSQILCMSPKASISYHIETEPSWNPMSANDSKVQARKARQASADQGCQMVCFQTRNPKLGKFWMAFDWKCL
jgi:hypothetical protein